MTGSQVIPDNEHFIFQVLEASKIYILGNEDKLEKLADNGWLRPHETSEKEISSLPIIDLDSSTWGIQFQSDCTIHPY